MYTAHYSSEVQRTRIALTVWSWQELYRADCNWSGVLQHHTLPRKLQLDDKCSYLVGVQHNPNWSRAATIASASST